MSKCRYRNSIYIFNSNPPLSLGSKVHRLTRAQPLKLGCLMLTRTYLKHRYRRGYTTFSAEIGTDIYLSTSSFKLPAPNPILKSSIAFCRSMTSFEDKTSLKVTTNPSAIPNRAETNSRIPTLVIVLADCWSRFKIWA